MRGRLLFNVVLFGLFALFGLFMLGVNLTDGGPVFTTRLVEPLALLSISWVMIIGELGKRAGGHVRPAWIVVALALPVLTLVIWLLSLSDGERPVLLAVGGLMVVGAAIATPGAVIANHRGRLGSPAAR